MHLFCFIVLALIAMQMDIVESSTKVCPHVVKRCEWGAYPSRGKVRELHQVSTVLMHYPYYKKECSKCEECIKVIRDVQYYDLVNHVFPDTFYSYFLAFDGTMYEGTGWNTVKPLLDPQGFDIIRIGIVGGTTPSSKMLETFFSWLNCKMEGNYLLKNYTVWFGTSEEIKAIEIYKKDYPSIYRRFRAGIPIMNYRKQSDLQIPRIREARWRI